MLQSEEQTTGDNAGQSENQDESLDTESNDGSNEQSDEKASDIEIPGKVTAFGDKSTMNNNVNGRELPIYCVDTEENKVALSFDAAWGAEDTQEILDILEEHNIHVTFFATGGWVESYPDDAKAVLAAGHDLGNHSENHKNMSQLSNGDKEEELMSVHRKVKELTGYDMYLFRPPYGDYDNDVINVAKDCGYYAIQWDVDSLDWQNKGVDSIIETVTKHKNLGNGSIILCHNGADYTAQALDTLITKLEEQGYEIVPVSELIYADGFHLDYAGRQIEDNLEITD
ncbi:MAG: polysaccharide deacetylase family protein [Lachnospiraceae bacterium]|nr:polysaccharide deacetylase family protein [Lachnospiraceae bacterium]